MDCYLWCDVDNLVVPSNQDIVNMFPFPSSWSQWELLSAEAFDPMSKCFVTQKNSKATGLNFSDKSQNKVGIDLFEYQQDEHSISSDFGQDLKEISFNQDTSSCDISDYQLDDLDITNQIDETFLNSSRDISAHTFAGPFDYYGSEFESDEYDVLPSDGLFENMNIEYECDPSHLSGMGSSKYLKTHASSPSMGGGAILYTQFPKLRDGTPSPIEAQHEEVSISHEFEIMDEHSNKETSETFVLQELEIAMTQMSDCSRICFRDALYRLAENSRQQSKDLALERAPPLMVHDANSRSENSKIMETETNAVDRAVANIMFYKMDSKVQNRSYCHSSLSGDAEVPIYT